MSGSDPRTRRFFWILVCLLLVLVIAPEPQQPLPRAEAATFTVNSLADTEDGTCDVANCTLREAVAATNTAGGEDVIGFSVSGTIYLTSQLNVTDTLTINGSGITLDGSGTTQILAVYTLVPRPTVTLNNLTFRNGNTALSGGVIINAGTMTINNSTFTDNTATGNGGAIFNAGAMKINNSTFTDNTATGIGGAIHNGGTVEINSSTFSNNMAWFGGAINSYRTVEINSSTFSGNTAEFGGTIFTSQGTTTVESSLMVGGDCYYIFSNGTITDGGNNLAYNAFDCPGTVVDPQLGPLQNNGGPTETMLPALTGPAVDAYAAPCATTTDQRGITRPQGSRCDIGATEQAGLVALTASAVCNGPDLAVTITAGDGPFDITGLGRIQPLLNVNTGTHTLTGPGTWRNLTVTETAGDGESLVLGDFVCRPDAAPPFPPPPNSR